MDNISNSIKKIRRVMLVGNGQYYQVGAHFRKALDDIGMTYVFIDEWKYLKQLSTSYLHNIFYHLFQRPTTYGIYNREIIKKALIFKPDILLIIKGSFINPSTLNKIKKSTNLKIVNLATDDPFNVNITTKDMIECIPHYDLYACTKKAIMPDIRQHGCLNVRFLPFGYEPSLHYLEAPTTSKNNNNYCNDVIFIGAADRDRIPIIRSLTQANDIKFGLFGGDWYKIKEFNKYYQGIVFGREYRLAIRGAKINIGLVRRANRDGHVMRTFEIPACGGFLLAERTEEHTELFIEGREAEFFGSNEEMIEKIHYYLRHESERKRITVAGHLKLINGNHTYRDRLIEILKSTDLI